MLADLVDLAEKSTKSKMLNFSDGLMDLMKNTMSAISRIYISGLVFSCLRTVCEAINLHALIIRGVNCNSQLTSITIMS